MSRKRNRRACLRCGKLFPSKGPGNRICTRCAKKNDEIFVPPIYKCFDGDDPPVGMLP